ncbi:MAG: PEGA domain-containing protein [Prolixibacteraceae bacterium]|nr:PEGA domain-containing protein [Prolixibacteraceae bacterium]
MKKNLVFIILLQMFFLNSRAQAPTQGFFLDGWAQKDAVTPQYIIKEKPVGETGVFININALDTVSKISPYLFGNNANTYSTVMYNNPTLVQHLKDMNPHVLRYPGGNLSNVFFWDLEANQRPDDMPQYVIDEHGLWEGRDPATWTMSVDNYYRFLDSVNCEGIICVNYAYARYGTSEDPVAKAAHYAADWVRYDNGRTRYWEIGNENFGNWQSGYKINTSLNKDGQPEYINGRIYGQHCRVFIDSMKAAATETGHPIYIGVQAWESETSWDSIQTDWNELMMPEISDLADFYIVHNYYTPYDENSDAQTILNTFERSEEFKNSVNADLAEAGFGPAPIALTEYNIFAVGSKQMVSHINGIHSVLVTGKLMEDEYGLATRWDLANGWSDGNDHGTFSRGEPGVNDFEPHPVYYYLTFMQRYSGDILVGSESGDENIISFASSFNNGPLGIIVVNKGNQKQTVSINTENFSAGEKYYWYTLEGGDLEGEFSRQVAINGHKSDRVAGGPSDYNSIEAFAAETNGGISLEAEPYSVHYLLVEGMAEPETSKYTVSIHVDGEGIYQETYPLANATVAIGSNTYQTDSLGNVTIDVQVGTHNLIVRKTGYKALSEEITIDASSSLTYTLQVESYQVEFVVKDINSQQNIENCRITAGGETKYTDSNGEVIFENLPSGFSIEFFKEHYNLSSGIDFSISGDTVLTLFVEKINYLVEFQIKDIFVGSGIWGVWIKVGQDSVSTNFQGSAYRELTFGEYDVSVRNSSYNKINTTVIVSSDTTFTYFLKPLYADIKFRLKNGTTPVNNAKISIKNDTLISSSTGIATFRDMHTDSIYSYSIVKDGYNKIEDELYLRRDTTLDIQLVSTFINENSLGNVKIWPNPANSEINISGLPPGSNFSGSIIDMKGREIKKFTNSTEVRSAINVEKLKKGTYLIRLLSGEFEFEFEGIFIKE